MPIELDFVQIVTVYGLGGVALVISCYYAIQTGRSMGEIQSLSKAMEQHLKDCSDLGRDAREDRGKLHIRINDLDVKVSHIEGLLTAMGHEHK